MTWKSMAYIQGQRLLGSSIGESLNEFYQAERFPASRLLELQQNRITEELKRAAKNIPYYCARVSNVDGLGSFPVLRKSDIRENFLDLMDPQTREEYQGRKRRERYSWLPVQTGGSTGVPTTVVHGPLYRDRGRAGRLYSRHLCGFPLGTPFFRLWGSMKEINESKETFLHRAQSYLTDEIVVNAFRMEDAQVRQYIDLINSSSVDHMMAYVDAAVHMARFIEKTNTRVKPLKSIMACAGTVTPDVEEILSRVFQCNVHNQYGSRDCSGIACSCERGGMHIYSNVLAVEVVGEDDRALPVGQTGRVLVTLLGNYEFPMIRYEIGDVGALSAETCPCGRPFPLLKSIEGRSVEFLVSTEGGYVSPVYIRHLIGVVHNPGVIRRFQLVQQTEVAFELRLELESGVANEAKQSALSLVRRDLRTVLGERSELNIVEMDEIPLSGSGKFLYTINLRPPAAIGSQVAT